MLEFIAVLFGSTGFGTIIGLLGSAFTRWDERQKKKIEHAHDFEMAKLNIEELKLEQSHELLIADKELERAEVESELVINKGELDAFKSSVIVGSNKSGSSIIDGFNSLMRPLITLFFLWVTTWLTMKVHTLVGGLDSLNDTELVTLYMKIIATILFLTSTSVTWWFGARPTKEKR